MLVYGILLCLGAAIVRDRCRSRGLDRLASAGSVAVWFGPAAAGFDALENACLLLTIARSGAAFPFFATLFAVCKFVLLAAALAYLIAGIAGLLRTRAISAAPPG